MSPEAAGPRVLGSRILVVEDETIIARDIAQTLGSLGYEVCGMAGTGEEAIAKAEASRPDLVLMDVRLRGAMDGIEAARRVRASLGTPIVFLTAFADEPTLERAREVEPYGYVLKPFEDRDLYVTITMGLCKHRAFLELDERVRRRTDELLRSEARYRHMAALAELSLVALRAGSAEELHQAAVRTVTGTVGADAARLFTEAADGSIALHLPADAGVSPERRFDASEVSFLKAVAGLLATALARDAAERRRSAAERDAQEERIRAQQALDAVQRRDEFLSIASHELRTPVTALQLQLQSLLQRVEEMDERLATKISRASRSTERLSALVETLLDVTRLSEGALTLRLEDVSVDDLVEQSLQDLAFEAGRAHAPLRALHSGLVARWDRVRVGQALTNLLANAIKYGAGGPVVVAPRLAGDDVEIAVSDRGPGVEAADASRIFERFERASSPRHYGGLGLGLYIAREIALAHGGGVAVESRPGEGSTFTLRLPREPVTELPAPS